MIILGIETSCDETGLAIVETDFSSQQAKFKVLSHALNSQTKIHEKYGGVFPMMAKRAHAENLVPLLEKVLKDSERSNPKNDKKNPEIYSQILENLRIDWTRDPVLYERLVSFVTKYDKPPIDVIAVTVGPGLEPCLWTGINCAKALSAVWNVPIVPTNHMEGHIASVLLPKALSSKLQAQNSLHFPAIALLISGGHTELVLVKNWGEYEIIGRTKDDAVGEAFDKGARILGLPYPGGPHLAALAEQPRHSTLHATRYTLPRPMIYSKELNFSFSGLKTALLYTVKKISELTPKIKKTLALEFENAIVEVLTTKTKKALEQYPVKSLIVGGGVIANKTIRASLSKLAEEFGVEFHLPTQALSTDNAIMIAVAGAINFKAGKTADPETIKACGNLSLC